MLARRIIPCLDVKDGRVVKGINFLSLRQSVTLPPLVTFLADDEGCDVTADRTSATCSTTVEGVDDFQVIPRIRLDPRAPADKVLGTARVTWLVSDGEDADPADNTVEFPIRTTPVAADLALVGRTPADQISGDFSLNGKVGQSLTIQFLPWNNGPAAALHGATTDITAPAGTVITKLVETGCAIKPGGRTAHCADSRRFDISPPGEFTLTLRLVSAPGGKDGTITVASDLPDPVPGNNTQKIVIAITGKPGAPAGGGSPSGGNAAGVGGAGGGGGLAATGANHPGGFALAGTVALLVGAALTVVARRRVRTNVG